MLDTQLAQILHEKYALSQVTEKAETGISTLYAASNTWGSSTAEVELFNEPVSEDAARTIGQVAGSLQWLEDPAVVRIRDCGVTQDGRLYVVRDEAHGSALRSLIDGRVKWGTPFTYQEAERLLGPVAKAIDRFNASGHPNFLARSIDPDHLLVQQGAPVVPVVLTLAGPTAGAAGLVSESKNRRQFSEVVSQLTSKPVDEELLAATDSAADYLASLANLANPQPAPQPEPQYWQPESEPEYAEPEYAKAELAAPRPQQQFPDTDPGAMQAVPAAGPTAQYGFEDFGQPVYEAPKKKRKAWPWVLAAVLLLAASGGGGYWWYTQEGSTKAWAGADAEIARQFPQLISEKDGGKGFEGMTCHSQVAEGDATGKIRCSNADAGVSVFKYDSAEKRDASMNADGKSERFGNDSCKFTSTELTGQDLPAYYLAPEGDLSNYNLLVNGKTAEQLRLQLPIC